MSQHDMSIANQSFPATRSDLNDALQALASTSKGTGRPATPYAGQLWLDDNTPSSTVWSLFMYDGTDDILIGYVDSTNNVFRHDLGPITNSLGADVNLNNTSNYFDGPSVAQGTTGTWFASGTVTVLDTAGGANLLAKLWDGTTVIASTQVLSTGTSVPVCLSLSGFITAPAGNLRISVRDSSSTSGVIKFNVSGNSKDSTITAIRIG